MSTGSFDHDESEDSFSDTRMSFWDHIEELRKHMWRAIVGFVIALLLKLHRRTGAGVHRLAGGEAVDGVLQAAQ